MAPVFAARTAAFCVASVLICSYAFIGEHEPDFAGIIIVTGIVALLNLWTDVYTAGFMGLETMTTIARVSVMMRLVGLIAVVAVLAIGLGVFAVLALKPPSP